jgi:hypothetical protein
MKGHSGQTIIEMAVGLLYLGITAAIAAFVWSKFGGWALLGVLAALAALAAAFPVPPEPLTLVADKDVFWKERIHGDRLIAALPELDRVTPPRVPKLSTFVVPSVGLRAARHDPARVAETVRVLLQQDVGPRTREALEALSAALDHLTEHGARCCLIPSRSWSGLIETKDRKSVV